jgi:hypothetical protein
MQMVAGGPGEPIWLTNIIAGGTLCTLTYTWPGIDRRPFRASVLHARRARPGAGEGALRRA